MPDYSKTRRACFFCYPAMASVFSMPPMLFVTFHGMYGISYTLLGTLILINFCTQLAIDLIFTFFSKHFDIKLTVRVMPLITSAGLIVYSLVPAFFPQYAFAGLAAGTVIFSVAAGLCEVLISPIVASIPSDHPEKDMSFLHSLYGLGVLGVVLICTAFFRLFGTDNWIYLSLFWAVPPVISSLLFFLSPMPETEISQDEGGGRQSGRAAGLAFCAGCIFLGSSSENIMTGWISNFMEKALLVPKTVGDIFGMAVFALLLTLGRLLYSKFGKNIVKTLLISMLCAFVCYLAAGLSPSAVLAFIACIFTGFFTSMLWPGSLIMMEEKVPHPGVAAYALMAASGDLGASFAPQLTGVVIDKVAAGSIAEKLSAEYSLAPEQIGLKFGMLCAAVFPLLGSLWIIFGRKLLSKKNEKADSGKLK